MNARHIDMDDMAEFGERLNAGRVGKLTGAELNCSIADRVVPTSWPPRRGGVSCNQGDAAPTAVEARAEVAADADKPVKTARPGLSLAEFRESCALPAKFVGVAIVAAILILAMKFMGPQQ